MTTQNTNYSPPQIPAGRRSSHSPRHAPGALPAPPERCPYCGATSGVQPTTGTSPRVKAWSLHGVPDGLGQSRWLTRSRTLIVSRRPSSSSACCGRLSRWPMTLPGSPDEQLRNRLVALALMCPGGHPPDVLKAECRHLLMVVTPSMRHALRQALLGLCLPGGHGSGVAHRIDLMRQLVPAALHRD
jgi:hypothetical protein